VSALGAVNPAIGFEFLPLSEEDKKVVAEVQKLRADTAAVLITNGILSPEEGRSRLSADPDSGYDDIDAHASVALPEPEDREETEPAGQEIERPAASEPGEENVQVTSLNGAQIASMVDIVTQIAQGALPRESGLNILLAAFPLDRATAESIIGPAGTPDFIPAQASPQGGQQNGF
jgi:hypothetical protein